MTPRRVSYPWMTAPDTQRLIDIFADAGEEIRFVGGCVRDSLLGRQVSDIDIATSAAPDRILEVLQGAGVKSVPTGIEHGTVTAVVEGRTFEITTYRRDIRTDGRHAIVEFGTDWRVDAERRDFTINAMSLTPDGVLHDPFDGEDDLRAGRVRFVGDAERRVREDILRILRWFRFHAHYGAPPPDQDALGACRGFAFRLPDLSGERLRHELLRLLGAKDPLGSLSLMFETDVIDAILGRGRQMTLISGLCEVEGLLERKPDPVLRLAALIGSPGAADPLSERLRLSNAERKRIVDALGGDALDLEMPEKERMRWFYYLGASAAQDRILLAWAAEPTNLVWRVWFDAASSFKRPVFPLSGRDVTALGIASGPEVGALLRRTEEWWVGKGFAADRDHCLRYLRDISKE